MYSTSIWEVAIKFDRRKDLSKGRSTGGIEFTVWLPYFQERVTRSIGIRATKEQWDNKRNRFSKRHPNHMRLNIMLDTFVSDIETFNLEAVAKGLNPKFVDYESHKNRPRFKGFVEYCNYLIKQSTSRESTKQHYRASLKYVRKIGDEISFYEINSDFWRELQRILLDAGMQSSSAETRLKHIRKFILSGIDDGLIERRKFPINLKKAKKSKVFLTEDEIRKIESLDLHSDELDKTKRRFLFMIYSGLRDSDMNSLRKSDVRFEDDRVYIRKIMEKTGDEVVIPLSALFHKKACGILKEQMRQEGDFVFTKVSNQHFNRMLKALLAVAQIDKKITSHSGRVTFATTLNSRGVNLKAIQRLMGHRSHHQTMTYIELTTKTLEEHLNERFEAS
ncbi:MAG: tyrosine-type recombinase/integrase [Bacteroidota bacterium]